MIAFDLGGTWWRSAVVDADGAVRNLQKEPSVSYWNRPGLTVGELQRAMVDHIIEAAEKLDQIAGVPIRTVSLCVGAALNAHTERILNAAQWWGPGSGAFDLIGALKTKSDRFGWRAFNDLTCEVVRHIHDFDFEDAPHVGLITVSTGIAARIYDLTSDTIPVSRLTGLQGEIGHMPGVFLFRGRSHELECDCGSTGHINAFSSGRGLDKVCRLLARELPGDFAANWPSFDPNGSPQRNAAEFEQALRGGNPMAGEILDATLAPLARAILIMNATDPLLEKVIITGGVTHALAPLYLSKLKATLESLGAYQISELDKSYFETMLEAGVSDGTSGLVGAVLAAQTLRTGHEASLRI